MSSAYHGDGAEAGQVVSLPGSIRIKDCAFARGGHLELRSASMWRWLQWRFTRLPHLTRMREYVVGLA